MEIQGAIPWQFQQPSGKQLSVCDDNEQFGTQILEETAGFIVPQRGGLMNREAKIERAQLHRRRLKGISPPRGFVRLGYDSGDRVPRVEQGLEDRNREGRRAGENDAR